MSPVVGSIPWTSEEDKRLRALAPPLFEENSYRGLRRVIDISGDGPNNNGVPVTGARRGAREGHHHQRPADHGEGAVICDDGHR